MQGLLLPPTTILLLLIALYTKCIRSQQFESLNNNNCIDLNFQAAALQGGNSCKLFNAILDDGDDLFTADISDVEATCSDAIISQGGGEEAKKNCVDVVVDVAARIDEEGCDITGGIAVSNFISKVNESQDVYSLLTQLACTRSEGKSCYTAIQESIGYCYQKIENCLGRVPCDCVLAFMDLLEELLKDAALMESYTELDDSVIDIIKGTESSCRCEVRNSLLENNPSCAILNTILQEGDILAGNNNTQMSACDSTSETTCAENIINAAHGLIMEDCPVTSVNASFITSLDGTSEILFSISDFACDKDCYLGLQNCQKNDTLCDEESLSCDCIMSFMNILDNLSPSSKSELVKLNDTTARQLQESFRQCECDALNKKAAMLKNETYCSLYGSIIRDESIFIGNLNDAQSTCVQRYACSGNVTGVVNQISNTSGCDLQQDTDELAQFFFTLDNSCTDLEMMTAFICDREDCYKDVWTVVEGCRGKNSIENCAKSSTSSGCFDAFLSMVDSIGGWQ